jgi:hypothetical protein
VFDGSDAASSHHPADIFALVGHFNRHVSAVGSVNPSRAMIELALDEYFEICSHEGIIIPSCQLPLQPFQFLHPFIANGAVNLIGQSGCGSAASRAEWEDVNLHKSRPTTGFQSLFELDIGLAGKAHDHIGREGGIVQTGSHLIDRLQKPVSRVTSPHPGEDRVGSALQSRMELRAQMFAVGGRGDEVFIDFRRLDAL